MKFVDQFFKDFKERDLTILWLSWFPYIVLTNGKAVEAVLSSNATLHKSEEYKYLEPWIRRGLLTSGPDKWKHRRKLLRPAFNNNLLRESLQVVNRHSSALLQSIKENIGAEMDLFKIIPLITFDIICETIIGECVQHSGKYINAVLFITEMTFQRLFRVRFWLDFIFYRTKFGKKYNECIQFVHSLSRKVVEKRIEQFVNESTRKLPNVTERNRIFLDILIEKYFCTKNSAKLSVVDICEEVDTFIFEGFETTAATICWTLHLLGNNEEIQNKAYEEIIDVVGKDAFRFVTLEDLKHLKYLECCIKEALRLYPPVPYYARKTTQSLQICGQAVPENMTVVICPFALHRDASIFEKPNDFIPERFMHDRGSKYKHSFIPFSVGPRNCIGQQFAMNEITAVVANILRHYAIKSISDTKHIPVSISLITRTKSPFLVKFVQRE